MYAKSLQVLFLSGLFVLASSTGFCQEASEATGAGSFLSGNLGEILLGVVIPAFLLLAKKYRDSGKLKGLQATVLDSIIDVVENYSNARTGPVSKAKAKIDALITQGAASGGELAELQALIAYIEAQSIKREIKESVNQSGANEAAHLTERVKQVTCASKPGTEAA